MSQLFLFSFLAFGVVALCVVVVFLLLRARRPDSSAQNESLAQIVTGFQHEVASLRDSLQQQVSGFSKQVNEQLSQHSQMLSRTYQGYSEAVGQVHHRLGELQQSTKTMVEISKDISSFQDIFKAPKLRGGMGELFLGELLRQILPAESFSLQYAFRDNTKVDAVIKLGDGLVPVDAKFPLENFKRVIEAKNEEDAKPARKSFVQNVKKHIDDIAAKYILPDENTFDFALMYIPAENVYYETIIKDEMGTDSIADYALKKRVIPVSPNSFYAYLQAIARGLKGLRIEKSAQLILQNLGQLEADFQKFLEDFEKVGGHLENSVSAYRKAEKRFDQLRHHLNSIEGAQKEAIAAEPLVKIEGQV